MTRQHQTGNPQGWVERLPKCPTSGKRCHPSEESAEYQADDVEAARGPDPLLNTYLCPCGSWHVGRSAPDREPRPRRHRR